MVVRSFQRGECSMRLRKYFDAWEEWEEFDEEMLSFRMSPHHWCRYHHTPHFRNKELLLYVLYLLCCDYARETKCTLSIPENIEKLL